MAVVRCRNGRSEDCGFGPLTKRPRLTGKVQSYHRRRQLHARPSPIRFPFSFAPPLFSFRAAHHVPSGLARRRARRLVHLRQSSTAQTRQHRPAHPEVAQLEELAGPLGSGRRRHLLLQHRQGLRRRARHLYAIPQSTTTSSPLTRPSRDAAGHRRRRRYRNRGRESPHPRAGRRRAQEARRGRGRAEEGSKTGCC